MRFLRPLFWVEPDPVEPAPADNALRIMTYNVHSCVGMDGRLSPERIAQVIARHHPDIIALQELDVRLHRSGGIDQAEAIARILEMPSHFHPSYGIEDGQFGNAIFSRYPVKIMRAAALPPRPRAKNPELRGALWVSIDTPLMPLQFINTHLSVWPRERFFQVKALCADWLREATALGKVVLCGDFNAVPGSPTYRQITHFLRDAQRQIPSHRPHKTWFGRYPLVRIDHIFISPSLQVTSVRACRSALDQIASDHLPLIAEVKG